MITDEQLEKFRKENCFCEEVDIDFCSKCGQSIEEQRPCIYCKFVNDLIISVKHDKITISNIGEVFQD